MNCKCLTIDYIRNDLLNHYLGNASFKNGFANNIKVIFKSFHTEIQKKCFTK